MFVVWAFCVVRSLGHCPRLERDRVSRVLAPSESAAGNFKTQSSDSRCESRSQASRSSTSSLLPSSAPGQATPSGVERLWRRQNTRASGKTWSTAAWPRTLTPEHVACLLLPLPAGSNGAAARNLRPIADPVFTSGMPLGGAPRTDPVLELLLTWTQNPAQGHTARLAPPIIEIVVQGKVQERWAETFDVDWPLPLADGL
jgi:hypothetical protein